MRTLLTFILALFVSQVLHAKPFAIQRWQTSNGTPVVFYQAMEVPILDIGVAFAAGSAHDGEQYGLSALTTQLLNQGNAGLDATTIAERLANTGAQYNSETSRDMIALALRTLTNKESLDKAIDTFTLIISKPDFPVDAFNREKNQQIMTIRQHQESPEDVANLTFFQALYQQHPYAHPIEGYTKTVNSLELSQVKDFYHRYFVSKNAVIVMVGAIDKATARQIAEKLVSSLPKGQPAAMIPKANKLSAAKDLTVQFPSSQTFLRLGQIGIDHHVPNYFPLMVGNYILGGGALVSELALEIREKRGLTYGVYSQFAPMPGDGPFLISLSTKSNQAQEALDLTRKTLASFVTHGPTQSELTAAKQYLVGSFPLSLASNQSIANMLLKMAFYQLPNDYLDTYVDKVKAVTIEEIKQSFQQTIHPDKLLRVAVGAL